MMARVMSTMLWGLMLFMTASCKDMKVGEGIRAVVRGDVLTTLDGDTFDIQDKIGDSVLIVRQRPKKDEPYFLLKRERNGYYYILKRGDEIYPIDNTQDFVHVDEEMVYDLKCDTSFSLPCDVSYIYYLGRWKGEAVFTNQDSICFSDGKCVTLQGDAFCKASDTEGNVVLGFGARRLEVSMGDLYHYDGRSASPDGSVTRFTKDYFIRPRTPYESVDAGFDVDLDIPAGNSDCDNAIREWMVSAIRDDAFSLLGYQKDVPVGHSGSVRDVIASLDTYGVLWEQLCRNYFQEEDTLVLILPCHARVRKVADCDDYATYYYGSSVFNGGLHELPKSYYITYDKRRKAFLNARDAVKPSMMKLFREEVLRSIKPHYDDNYVEKSSWESFLQSVFSFHCPIIDLSDCDEIARSLLEHEYVCDEWSGWEDVNDAEFTLDNFPLPHLAVLPEGVVVTYHPYQIDCFASGEYHALVPFDKVGQCLRYEYRHCASDLPKIEQFIK